MQFALLYAAGAAAGRQCRRLSRLELADAAASSCSASPLTVALIIVGNAVSWLLGHIIVTPFQLDIYRTAAAAGWLPLLWLAVVVVTPIGEETLFRGFLFRGWLRTPRDVWPVILVTALLWAMVHVQYDWYVIAQVFVFGVMLGWLRWATGSTILTMLLHAMINCEGMLETVVTCVADLEQRRDAGEGRMLRDAGGQPRQADHLDAVGKTRDAGDGIVELHRIALALATPRWPRWTACAAPARRAR